MIKNYKWLFLVALTFAACSDDEDNATNPADEPITAGSADFSKYVALGNSLTAGFSDNALFIRGQENSYPNHLAQQFALAGGGSFSIPYMSDNTGGLLFGGNMIMGPRLSVAGILATPGNPNPSYGPIVTPVPGAPTTEVTTPLSGPFNNMGIPGAKSYHLLAAGYGNAAGVPAGLANPYYVRFASSPGASVIGDAVAQNPTFFSLWIGANDVLTFATSGGVGVNQVGNPNPATYGNNDITDPDVFNDVYRNLLDALTANGAKGVVANIPYVTSIPFFRTVPHNPIPMDAATAQAVNGAYAAYNGGLAVAVNAGLITEEEKNRRTISFEAGTTNKLVIVDSYLTNLAALGLPSYRQATAEDLPLLTARSFIGTTVGGNPQLINGVTVPLADNWILSKDEVAEIKVATDEFNTSIRTLAQAKGLAIVDANAILNQLYATGIRIGNFHMTASFVTGGAFSLDGVHPSARGYAYLANKFLEAINETYGSNFRGVNPMDYPIQYPVAF